MWTRINSSTEICSRAASGSLTASESFPKAPHCHDVTKLRIYVMQVISSAVVFDLDARFSARGSNRGR